MHRRAHNHRRPGGDQGRGKEIVSESVGVASEEIGSGWSDNDQVGLLPQPGMGNG